MDDTMLLPLRQDRLAVQQEIRACCAYTEQFGLTLSEAQIAELAVCREEALRASGRIEFGGGILPKIMRAFCDSPYLDQENCVETFAALQEAFYYYKTESKERLSDEELLSYMVRVFNGQAQGSVEYLTETALDALCRAAKAGAGRPGEKAGDLLA